MSQLLKYCVCLFIFSAPFIRLHSQSANELLEAVKSTQSAQFKRKLEVARAYAQRNSIPLSINTQEGQHLLLVAVENDVPIYLAGLNNEAATTTNAASLRMGGSVGVNIEGEGMLIGVWDEGFVKNHIELGNRVVSKEGDEGKTHATHVTGTLIASGVNPMVKGMAPKARATTWYFDNDVAEMAALAKPDASSLLVSNHSYGTVTGWQRINNVWQWFGDASVATSEDYRFGFYGERALGLDQLAASAPYYTIVWAAGNDRFQTGDGTRPADCNGGTGYDCIIPESVAKNIITVGAINKVLNYTGPASITMSDFSSWGPTDDGRIKPDLVGAGVNLLSLSASGEDMYTILSGTSQATPNVAGSLLLLQQLYSTLNGGRYMRAATLKALAIHTAKEAGSFPGPDYSFGWGLLDAAAAARLLINQDARNTILLEKKLLNGGKFELTLNPKANQKITATLVWTDPEGKPASNSLDPTTLMLVNDLDVKLISESGAEFYPWILDPTNPSRQATKGNNFRDNVEKLEFNLPELKPYRLVINHKGQLKNNAQDFSLIITYSSTTAGKSMYWIGDEGNWSDGNHWSLTSGGAAINQVPSPEDVVIVDENSFDGLGDDLISLNQSVVCRSVRWIRSGSSGIISTAGNTITVSKDFVASYQGFSADGLASIICKATGGASGSISFNENQLINTILIIDGGNWTLNGNVALNRMELNAGDLSMYNNEIQLETLVANSAFAKKLNLINSKLQIGESMTAVGTDLEINPTSSSILVKSSSAVLDWQNVSWGGNLVIEDAQVSVNGSNNQLESVKVRGGLNVVGSNLINTLHIQLGSSLTLGTGAILSLGSQVNLESTETEPITISAPGNSTIDFPVHQLFCFDHLDITNVNISGVATINAGIHSTMSNSSGWLTETCENVLFPRFEILYNCAWGITEFVNTSTGPFTESIWDFGDQSAEFVELDVTHTYEIDGPYQVNLTIKNSQSTSTYSQQISILENSLPENHIAINSDELTSYSSAQAYQWYRENDKIGGATSRRYMYKGEEGSYFVVTYGGGCNRVSDQSVITGGLEKDNPLISIYPNPASEYLTIEIGNTPSQIAIIDLVGKKWIETPVTTGRIELPVAHLPSGMFILTVKSKDQQRIKKILIRH